jgi:cobalt-precorrin 5A hydrolase
MSIAIIAITANGARLGARLQECLPGSQCHVLARYQSEAGRGAAPIHGELKELMAKLWPRVTGIVCIMATGIVVRLAAPLLAGKEKDPAVVVMDEAGRFAISLLSGHLGGGNDLAERCAFIVGAQPVITTATDVNNLPSFDLLARDHHWQIEDLSRVKLLNSLLLDGKEIAVVDDSGQVRSYFRGRGNLVFYDSFVAGMRSAAPGILFVTNSTIPRQLQSERLLVLRPRDLAVGVGCNKGTSAEEIMNLIQAHLQRLLLSPASIACLATAEAKRQEPGLVACAALLSVPLRCYESTQLNSVPVPSPPSPHAQAAIGAAGVAEPAAILASSGGRLLLQKVKDGNVTLAIALCSSRTDSLVTEL